MILEILGGIIIFCLGWLFGHWAAMKLRCLVCRAQGFIDGFNSGWNSGRKDQLEHPEDKHLGVSPGLTEVRLDEEP